MRAYQITLQNGSCTIVMAKARGIAERWGRDQYGREFFLSVKPATDAEVEWVRAMGGKIHTTEDR